MLVLTTSFVISFIFCLLAIRYFCIYFPSSLDFHLKGVQKFHSIAVPRIGGLGIFIAIISGLLLRAIFYPNVYDVGLTLCFCALPIFLAGIAEDFTKRISARIRLIFAIISALMAGYILNTWITNVQIFGLDSLLNAYPIISVLLTCLSVAGVAHSFNIIDGYNGLSSVVGVIILLGLSYVAFQVSDTPLMIVAFSLIGALLGFLCWNYPRGLIFLGDGGAYLIGFFIAEISILLTMRHSEVSKWFPLLLCIYPIFETVFTIYRRVFIKRISPGIPDAFHLHQLIYRRVAKFIFLENDGDKSLNQNSITSPFLWALTMSSVIPAVLFWRHQFVLIIFVSIFIFIYMYIYRSLVKFITPSWLQNFFGRRKFPTNS